MNRADGPQRTAVYLYDPIGRRFRKCVVALEDIVLPCDNAASVITEFLSDGVEEITDHDGAGNILRRYIHGPGVDEPLVMMVSYDAGSGAETARQYYHADYAGSIVAMSDGATGAIDDIYTYSAYGEVGDATGNPFRYTGRRLDAETGLYYYRARYYSSALGRFLQTDPIGYGDNMNMYAYVGNDPVTWKDPSGKAECADPDCKTSFIDSEISKGPAPFDSSISGAPNTETISVTFNNDSGTNDPRQPVSTETAVMVEQGLKKTEGVSSVNINSTTGGTHGPTSNHFKKTAVDINRINGGKVLQGKPDSAPIGLVQEVQDSFANQPNIQENFGPTRNEKTLAPGSKAVSTPSTAAGHQNHIHVSGQN